MQTNWSDWLASAEFAYNNRSHSSTDHSPFYLEYSQHPQTPLTINASDSNVPTSNNFITTLSDAHASAYHTLERTAVNMKCYADNKQKEAPQVNKYG